MKNLNRKSTINFMFLAVIGLIFISACSSDTEEPMNQDVTYTLSDQMGRPAINTVFNGADADKDAFNMTVPSLMAANFQQSFEARLLALNPGYTTNALGMDAATFTGALATDVLTVATSGTTTFFDGTNVLTGRALDDDVISVELLLIFGGPMGTDNPGLTDDHVDANDKAFLNSFPYLASPH